MHGKDRYDPRYHNRASFVSESGRTNSLPRSNIRPRRSWPPQPYVEDELASLRRESHSSQRIKDVNSYEAPSRGTIDQEPVIIDLQQPKKEQDRRCGVSGSERGSSTAGIPTPPTSEDERARKVRRRPSKLQTDLENDVPELGKRTASPYAFSGASRPKPGAPSGDRFLSPDTLTPSSMDTTGGRGIRSTGGSKPSSPNRDIGGLSPGYRRGKDYFSAGSSVDESAIDDTEYDSAGRGNARDKRVPSTRSDYRPSKPKTSVAESVSPAASALPSRRVNLDARRNTDTQDSLPSMAKLNVEKPRQTSSMKPSSALSEAYDSNAYSSSQLHPNATSGQGRLREPSYSSSRTISSTTSIANPSPTPPRSPRLSTEPTLEGGAPGSRAGSKAGSTSGSRPSSPRASAESPRLPKTDLDWGALLAANAARKPKPSSRLASNARHETAPDMARRSNTFHVGSVPTASLPYPEDFGPSSPFTAMPSEEQHQWFPDNNPTIMPFAMPNIPNEAKGHSRENSFVQSSTSSTSSKTARPALSRGFSATHLTSPQSRSMDGRSKPPETKRQSVVTSSQTKKELAGLMKKGLPPCPRPEPVSGKDDWYTLIGAPKLDICPDCVDNTFERSIFRPSFRRAPPRNLDSKVQCAFGSSPWVRIAWLLTLQQQRTDLGLLKDIAEIEDTTVPCPGGAQTVQSWYGLRDLDGLFVRDFHVCYCDVRKIERMLPSLSGIFVRLPSRVSYEKRICALRTEGNRFSAYLDALIATHEQSTTTRKGADPMPLIDLVERKTRLRECTRDNMLLGGLWHFIPSVPSLTVCEDCYESLVEPEVNKDSDVAMRFNRTVQPVYGEGLGSSCQLYSARMRKIFRRAVEDNDLKYLARKSKERREAELRLQEKYKDVLRRAKRLALEPTRDEEEERRLNRELERISAEWKEKWE